MRTVIGLCPYVRGLPASAASMSSQCDQNWSVKLHQVSHITDAVSRTRYATVGYGDAHNDTTKEYHMRELAPKAANLRADRKPTEGYILTGGGKLKTRCETEKDATAAARN